MWDSDEHFLCNTIRAVVLDLRCHNSIVVCEYNLVLGRIRFQPDMIRLVLIWILSHSKHIFPPFRNCVIFSYNPFTFEEKNIKHTKFVFLLKKHIILWPVHSTKTDIRQKFCKNYEIVSKLCLFCRCKILITNKTLGKY